jgi:hypothetical protein
VVPQIKERCGLMDKIREAPVAGTGLHEWILSTSRQLLMEGYDRETVSKLMVSRAEGKGRRIEGEIRDAVEGAVKWLAEHPDYQGGKKALEYTPPICHDWLGSGYLDRRDNRPEYNEADRELISNVLVSLKPLKLKGSGSFNWWKLFADIDFNVCLCQEVWNMDTRPLSEWLGYGDLREYQYMVPSPMHDAGRGKKFKCDKNTSKRLWQIIEFDSGTREDQLKLLKFLSRYEDWPLGMIVFSGGKSLHGWFGAYEKTEYDIRTFFLEATKLGADRMMRIPSQYCRVPNGTNYKTRRKQQVIYWDEEVINAQSEIVKKDLL